MIRTHSCRFMNWCFVWALVAVLGPIAAAPSYAAGQSAEIIRFTNLHTQPGASRPTIRHLRPPDVVEVIDPAERNGYYHVRTEDNEAGWVYARNLRLAPPQGVAHAPANDGAADAISPDWDKPDPNTTSFQGDGETCGDTGDGGDRATNKRKNRTDVPDEYHLVTFDAVDKLPYPNAPKYRAQWTQSELNQIKPYEGAAITVVGHLVTIKVENRGSGESTNCHMTGADQVDWHMPLVASAGQGEEEAMVVETTPRVRREHPKWTTAALSAWEGSDDPVRISGWLMLDPEHRDMLGKYRNTLWEVHPITRIEVFRAGNWIDLDDLP